MLDTVGELMNATAQILAIALQIYGGLFHVTLSSSNPPCSLWRRHRFWLSTQMTIDSALLELLRGTKVEAGLYFMGELVSEPDPAHVQVES